jgi:hypothetical protein
VGVREDVLAAPHGRQEKEGQDGNQKDLLHFVPPLIGLPGKAARGPVRVKIRPAFTISCLIKAYFRREANVKPFLGTSLAAA